MGGVIGGLRKVSKACLEAACLQGILVRGREAEWDPCSCQNEEDITQGEVECFYFIPSYRFLTPCVCFWCWAGGGLELPEALLSFRSGLVSSLGALLRELVHFI